MKNHYHVYVWALGLGLLAAPTAFGGGREVALGAEGEVYTVRAGTYGQLFTKRREVDPANPVLALEITKPGAALRRILVPGTDGPEVENSPSVVFEDGSKTAFLLWETEKNVIHPILQLAGFDGASWTEPIDVVGNPFAEKMSFEFAVTRDAYEVPAAEGSVVSRHRTILHVVWQETTAAGGLATFYSPILIKDGEFVGANPVYNLDEYLHERVALTTAEVLPALARAPIIATGRDERTVVIAYASAAMGRLSAIEVDVLPEQLIQLADSARMHIVDLGREFYPTRLTALGEKARMHIVDLGRAFRPEVVQAMADQVEALILADGGEALTALADTARMHIVDLGAQLSGRGLRGGNGADATAKLVEIGGPAAENTADVSNHFFQFRVVSDLPIPRVGQGAVRLFVSNAGENLIVSWAQSDKVVYRNGRSGGWSEPRELQLSESLDLGKAYEILEQRVRNR